MQTTGELEAGRELDALVAKHVMGWTQEPEGRRWWHAPRGDWATQPDAYSTDIAAAWAVVEKMKANGWDFAIESDHTAGNWWWAQMSQGDIRHSATIDTAPLAICRAALAASGL